MALLLLFGDLEP